MPSVLEEARLAMTVGGKYRILIVDDDADVRAFLRTALEKADYEVIEAADGKQAVDSVSAGPVDLVVLDIVMPHQDGIATIQALRRNVTGIGIVAISGAFEGRYLKTAEALGADAAMGKPLRPEDLVTTVARILRSNENQGSPAE